MSVNARTQLQTKATPPPAFTPVQSGLLQRKCACGGSASLPGECTECNSKRLTMQRSSPSPRGREIAGEGQVPPIVHEVLRSPGQPLDSATRAFMEPRFGHDFSRVRIHTDAKAVESARAVNALAYTVGRDIVFGLGRYVPGATVGKRLLAHELTHVVQQDSQIFNARVALRLGSSQDIQESQAHALAASVMEEPPAEPPLMAEPALTRDTYAGKVVRTQKDAVEMKRKEKDDCRSLAREPQSLTRMVAHKYVQEELDPSLVGSIASVECGGPEDGWLWVCTAESYSGVAVRVHFKMLLEDIPWIKVEETQHSSGKRTPQGPECRYTYDCPRSGGVVLSKIICFSKRK